MYGYTSQKVQRKTKSAFSRLQPVQRCPARRRFTEDEDAKLKAAVEQYGENWISVAGLVPGHTPRQCRERWKYYLSPEPPVEWNDAMDSRLLDLVTEYGSRYEKIAREMGILAVSAQNRLRILAARGRTLRHLPDRFSDLPRVDRSKYFTSISGRPAFTRKTQSSLYAHGVQDGSRMLYPCVTGPDTIANLPRLRDATPDEKHSGSYATIGHKCQWRDYCADNCDMVLTDDGRYYAFLQEDIRRTYNDVGNLELQSQHYNSKIARPYGENPLAPYEA